MQFGVHLPHIGPWHDGDTLRRFALAVEEMGYDSVWVSDHIVFPLGYESRYPYAEGGQFPLPPVVPWLEPVTTLTFVAGATSRVKLGTSILVLPYRNPVLNAKQLGNLQTVSGGRLIVGAGAGWMREEAEALGMPWDERGARTDEHIQVLRALWTEEDPKFEGRFYRVTGLRCEPRPAMPPPVWVGGHEPPALRRAARLGDGWHAYRLTPDELARAGGRCRRWRGRRAATRTRSPYRCAGRSRSWTRRVMARSRSSARWSRSASRCGATSRWAWRTSSSSRRSWPGSTPPWRRWTASPASCGGSSRKG